MKAPAIAQTLFNVRIELRGRYKTVRILANDRDDARRIVQDDLGAADFVFLSIAPVKAPRYDVTHGDGVMVEVVRDLDLRTARRLVERDQGAGRPASMALVIPRRTYR